MSTVANLAPDNGGETRIGEVGKRAGRVFGAWLREEAKLDPDRAFVQCASPWITLSELDRLSDRVAAGLQQLGVGKGDRVAVNLPNRIEYVVLICAIAKTGAIQVPLNTYLRGEFLRHQLVQTTPRVYIGDAQALHLLAPLLPDSGIRDLVLVGAGDDGDRAAAPDALPYADLEKCGADLRPAEIGPDDVCAIIFTSGTTGASKGCTITHGYYCNLVTVFVDYEAGIK